MNDSQSPAIERPSFSKATLFFFVYIAVFVAGRILGISPGYALDDYVTGLLGSNDLNSQLLSQGRFTFAALNTLINSAGLQQTDFIGIGFSLLLICSALFSWGMFSAAMERVSWSWVGLTAALLASYPYFTEYVTFRQSLLPMGLMFGLSYFSLRAYTVAFEKEGKDRWRSIAVAVVTGVLAIGMNQLAISLLCVASLFVFISAEINTGTRIHAKVWIAIWRTALFGVLLTTCYVLILLLVKTGSDARATVLSLDQVPERIRQVALLLRQIFFTSDQLVPLVAKAGVMLTFLALTVLAIVRKQATLIGVSLVFGLLCTVLAILPLAIGSVWWPVPRTLIALPFVIVGSLTLIMPSSRLSISAIPLGLTGLSVILFCGVNYSILLDQQRLNRWDMETGRAIASTVATNFPDNQKPIILHGTSWAYPIAPTMALGDMNVSALSIGWSADAVIEEAAGRPLDVRVGDPAAATTACANRSRFPAPGAMYDSPEGIQICL